MVRPPLHDFEAQPTPESPVDRPSTVEERQPEIEWSTTVGGRMKKGRYSTGALFRPREKRTRRPLGGGVAVPDRDWSWPADDTRSGAPEETPPAEAERGENEAADHRENESRDRESEARDRGGDESRKRQADSHEERAENGHDSQGT